MGLTTKINRVSRADKPSPSAGEGRGEGNLILNCAGYTIYSAKIQEQKWEGY